MSVDKYPSIFSRQMEAIVLYISPNLQNCMRCEKDLKDNKHHYLGLDYSGYQQNLIQ